MPLPYEFNIFNIPLETAGVLQAVGVRKSRAQAKERSWLKNTLFEGISLRAEALEWVRVFKKSVQNKKRGPGAKEFGHDPTGSEEPIKLF